MLLLQCLIGPVLTQVCANDCCYCSACSGFVLTYHSGCHSHRLPVRSLGLPVPDLHLACVQQQRRVHTRCRCVRILDWSPNRQYLHNPAQQRYRHYFRCCSIRPASNDYRTPGSVRQNGVDISPCSAGHSCLRRWSLIAIIR